MLSSPLLSRKESHNDFGSVNFGVIMSVIRARYVFTYSFKVPLTNFKGFIVLSTKTKFSSPHTSTPLC